ncbi:MAG: site-2 protease family protein [Patescibacteria group bacterium]
MTGAVAFIFALLLLILVHEFGHFIVARLSGVAVDEFGFGFPPAIRRWQVGKTVLSLNWLPFGGFVRLKGEDGEDQSLDSFGAQPVWKRFSIVAAGVVMNMLLALVLFTAVFTVGAPQDITAGIPNGATVENIRQQVVAVLPESPAAEVLTPGETIVAIDGTAFESVQDLQVYVREHVDQPLSVLVATAQEKTTRIVTITPKELSVAGATTPVVGMGVQLAVIADVQFPIWRAPLIAAETLWSQLSAIGTTLSTALMNLLRGVPSTVDIAGPIGIAAVTGSVVSLGLPTFIQFVALLSLNLAFVNLLPIPALDGGRMAFLIIEAVRRKPVSAIIEARFHRIGFAALLLLLCIVTYADIGHLIRFGNVW